MALDPMSLHWPRLASGGRCRTGGVWVQVGGQHTCQRGGWVAVERRGGGGVTSNMVPCPYSDIIFLTRQSICRLSEKSNLSSPCSVLPLSRQWGMSWERYGSARHAPCSETVAIRCDEWAGACCHGKWKGWRKGWLAFLENFFLFFLF